MVFIEFVGLLVIIFGAAYMLSHASEAFAKKWGVTITGSLLLGLLTTLPEYTFVYWASVKGRYDMAIGSAIGACTLLVTLGYGLVILIATTKLSRKPVPFIKLSKATRIDAVFLLLTALVAFALVWKDNALDFVDGIILAAMFFLYVWLMLKLSHIHEDGLDHVPAKRILSAAVQMVIGGAVIFFVSEPFVDKMILIAKALQVSPVVIAIILGPIASEMPEKLTAYVTVRRNGGLAQISICNFIGSKVNHNSLLLAIIPFVALTHGVTKVQGLMSEMFLVMTGLTVLVSAALARGVIYRWHGAVLIACYVAAMAIAIR